MRRMFWGIKIVRRRSKRVKMSKFNKMHRVSMSSLIERKLFTVHKGITDFS
jgi:hypothetical protein